MTPTKSELGEDTAVQVTVCCEARGHLTRAWSLSAHLTRAWSLCRYEYSLTREYNWNVKNKASKGYEVRSPLLRDLLLLAFHCAPFFISRKRISLLQDLAREYSTMR